MDWDKALVYTKHVVLFSTDMIMVMGASALGVIAGAFMYAAGANEVASMIIGLLSFCAGIVIRDKLREFLTKHMLGVNPT